MNIDLEHTLICTTSNLWYAEGTSVNYGEQYKPTREEIEQLLYNEGWLIYDLEVFYDTFQSIWRWSCCIKRLVNVC